MSADNGQIPRPRIRKPMNREIHPMKEIREACTVTEDGHSIRIRREALQNRNLYFISFNGQEIQMEPVSIKDLIYLKELLTMLIDSFHN